LRPLPHPLASVALTAVPSCNIPDFYATQKYELFKIFFAMCVTCSR
jgi:hypothetical protein